MLGGVDCAERSSPCLSSRREADRIGGIAAGKEPRREDEAANPTREHLYLTPPSQYSATHTRSLVDDGPFGPCMHDGDGMGGQAKPGPKAILLDF